MNKKILLVIGGVLLLSNIGSSTYASVSKINDKVGAIKYITTATVQDNYFIIPYSSTSYLTIADLQGLTLDQLEIARNEIYARHGYIFVSDEWKDFFVNEDWYIPTSYSVKLNSIEEYNVAMIIKEEARR